MLATLLEAGFVEREPGAQRWQLGLRLVHLGNAALARLDLRDLARPLLEQLVRETGETATLSLPAQGEGVTVDFVPSPHSVSSRAEIGRAPWPTRPRSASSCSRTRRARSRRCAEPLERYTPRTLTTLAEIELAVAEVRAAGVAEAAGEREPGLNAIAAPVLGRGRTPRRRARAAGPGSLRRRGPPRGGAAAGARRRAARGDRRFAPLEAVRANRLPFRQTPAFSNCRITYVM